MYQSLRVRLLLLILAVLLITSGLSALFASNALENRFDEYYSQQQAASEERRKHLESILPDILETYYQQGVSRTDVDKLLETVGRLTHERILLTDARGYVIADSAYLADGQSVSENLGGKSVPIHLNDRIIAEFIVVPYAATGEAAEAAAFRSSINTSLLWAVLAAGTIAMLLTLALSQGILRPIEALTTAARRMGRGDLKQRVAVSSNSEIGELAKAFNHMADNLEHIEQLRRNMVTDIAHELRTPLSNIRGYLEAIQDGILEASPTAINSLHEEAMLLNHLVEDLQELALAEAGQLRLLRQPIAVQHIMERAALALRHKSNSADISLTVDLPANLPAVDVDAERIGQVVRNLLNNAFTHTPPGGTISLTAMHEDGHVVINVRNSGEGITPEHLPYVFERFYRADSSRTRATGGSGLGLAIVKQFVEAHGGRVWAESGSDTGTAFYFTLPLVNSRG